MVKSQVLRPGRISLPGGFLYRPVDQEARFIDEAPRHALRGLIIPARSHASRARGAPIQSARAKRIPHLIDPDTAVLAQIDRSHPRAQWLTEFPPGDMVERLPISPNQLEADEDCRALSRVVLQAQHGAAAMSSPYFRVEGAEDPWRVANRDLFAACCEAAAGRPVAAWLEVSLAALRAGEVVAIAGDFAAADFLVLRIAELRWDRVSRSDAKAVVQAIQALVAGSPRLIVDCTTGAGASACAAGAYAFSSGGNRHRSVPRVHVHKGKPSTPALGFELPFEGRQIAWELAAELRAAGKLEACPVDDRPALKPGLRGGERRRALREHFIHVCRTNAQLAQQMPHEFAERLRASADPASQIWGEAVGEIADSAAARIHSAR